MLRSNFFLLFFISIFSNCFFAQVKLDQHKSSQFLLYKNLINSSTKNINYNSLKLLENPQTPYEYAFANFIIGGNKYREGKYMQAINYYEEAEKLSSKLDSTDFARYLNNMLVIAYRRAGLIEQSNDAWQREKLYLEKSKNKYKDAEYYYSLSKLYDIDEDYCKASEARVKYLSLVPDDVQKQDLDFIFAVYAQLTFSQFKCGKITKAKADLQKAEEIANTLNNKDNLTLVEIYELGKALVLYYDNDFENSKIYFDAAYLKSKKKETPAITKLILEERVECNIDSADQQLKYLKEILEITKRETETTKELAIYETNKSKQKILKQSGRTQTWIIISIVSFIILSLVIFLIYKRYQNQKKAYRNILAYLDQKNFAEQKHKREREATSDKNKELENEDSIVKQLEHLEAKHFFTSKNVSAAQMAVLLKITPRNLSYILKKYRNDDFYNYLNNMRIDYMTQILRENPKLLNYKIAALADLCGYNSYSQFAVNFKSKTGISPSQYIQFLSKELK